MGHSLEPVDHDPYAAEELLKDHVLGPILMRALSLPYAIDNRYCVLDGAGRNNSNTKTYVDQHVPEFDKDFVIGGGQRGSLWRYVDLHEKTEFAVMTQLGMPYDKAHEKVATVLERHFVERDGGNWKEYEDVWDGYLDESEHELKGPAPPDLYMGPYSKAEVKKMGVSAPTLEPVSHDPFAGAQS